MTAILVLDIGGTKIAGGCVVLPSGVNNIFIVPPKPDSSYFDVFGLSIEESSRDDEAYSVRLYLKDSTDTQAYLGGEKVAEKVCEFAKLLFERSVTQGIAPQAVAVASAGVVDSDTGDIISATNIMPGWAGVKLGSLLSTTIGLPSFVLNDVHAHALGEATWGAGIGNKSALVMAVGTGIGGAYVVDGQVLFGAHNIAGHLGHLPHPLAAHFTCSCGRKGHVEAIASGSGITEFYNRLIRQEKSIDLELDNSTELANNGFEVYQRSLAGDNIAQLALCKSATALGEVLGALANSFDPAVIILSGSMTRSGSAWWDSLYHGYALQAMDLVANTAILEGKLGGAAPLVGAAVYAIRKLDNEGEIA